MAEKFIGLQYPLVKTAKGTFAKKNGVDQIKADLLQLLLTNPGERVMLPEFGTPLRQLMFEPNDTVIEGQARVMIAKAIERWEPRVAINAIEVTSRFNKNDLNTSDTGDELDKILGIKIEIIDPDNITEIQALELEVPLGGS